MKKSLILIAIVIGVFVLFWVFMGAVLPGLFSSKEEAMAVACRANLQEISRQKENWAYETNRYEGTPSWEDLGAEPKCPKGGVYSIGAYPESPRCSIGDNETASDTSDDHTFM